MAACYSTFDNEISPSIITIVIDEMMVTNILGQVVKNENACWRRIRIPFLSMIYTDN
jgi:hypothetical protein